MEPRPDKAKAEQWIRHSTTDAWKFIVDEFKESKEGYFDALKDPGNKHEHDQFYKGCIYVIERFLDLPKEAQAILDGPDEEEEPREVIFSEPSLSGLDIR